MSAWPVVLASLFAAVAVGMWMSTGPDRLLDRRLGSRDDRVGPHPRSDPRRWAGRRWRRPGRFGPGGPAGRSGGPEIREGCEVLTDELRSGAAVATAWQAAARVVRELLPAAAAARSGADVPAALLAVRARTGFGLRSVAAAWAVADRTGVPPADLVERVVDRMRDDEAVHREVEAQLAGPRVTARLLVGLPGFGLLIGSMLGYRPLRFLFGSPYGVACLVTGVAATAFGAWWIGRLAAGARVGSDL